MVYFHEEVYHCKFISNHFITLFEEKWLDFIPPWLPWKGCRIYHWCHFQTKHWFLLLSIAIKEDMIFLMAPFFNLFHNWRIEMLGAAGFWCINVFSFLTTPSLHYKSCQYIRKWKVLLSQCQQWWSSQWNVNNVQLVNRLKLILKVQIGKRD